MKIVVDDFGSNDKMVEYLGTKLIVPECIIAASISEDGAIILWSEIPKVSEDGEYWESNDCPLGTYIRAHLEDGERWQDSLIVF